MGWPLVRLGDIVNRLTNGFVGPTRNIYVDEGVPYLLARQVKDNVLEFDDRTYVSDEFNNKNKKSMLKTGDVLLVQSGHIGHSAVVPAKHEGHNCHAMIVLTPRSEILGDFLSLYFSFLLLTEKISEIRSGSTVPHLTCKLVKELLIPLPPIPQQKRIVAILDQAFTKIDQARVLAEQNLHNTRELFESYLQQVFSQRGEGWVETELFDHINFIDYRGKTPQKTSSGLRLITAKNVRMGYLTAEPAEFVDPSSYDEWMTRGIPQKGDILFTTEAPLANVAQLDTDEKVIFAQRIITMQPDRSIIDAGFLKYLLISRPVQKKIHEKGTGATAMGIKASLLKKIPIEFPSDIEEQRRHVHILDGLVRMVNQLETIYSKKLNVLDELKKSILQKAFTGQLTNSIEKTESEGAAA